MGGPFGVGPPDPAYPAYFRHRRVGEAYLVTNLVGQWAFLSPEEFIAFLSGTLERGSELHHTLAERNFIRSEVDLAGLTERMSRRKAFLRHGPRRHVALATTRCPPDNALWGAAPCEGEGRDMPPEVIARIVALAGESSAPTVTLELQGGEPLLAFDVVTEAAQRAREHGSLRVSVLTGLWPMDEAKLAFLVDADVAVRTTLYGPAALYDEEHLLPGAGAFAEGALWIDRLHAAWSEAGSPHRVDAEPPVTRKVLSQPEAFVDAYAELGVDELALRPLEPAGLSDADRVRLCYSIPEYLAFHRRVVDRLIAHNRAGRRIFERRTAVLLAKILTGEDPELPDLRSPCAAGIGELAYDVDGALYPCADALRLSRRGDGFFRLGEAGQTSQRQVAVHPKVQAMLFASNLDASPDCAQCAFSPFCGICPVRNFQRNGSLHGPVRDTRWCAFLGGLQDDLFRRLQQAEPEVIEIFGAWARRVLPKRDPAPEAARS